MNDEFLYQQLNAQPRPEFARTLYEKIDRPAKEPARALFLRRLAVGFAALLLALALTLTVSPAARAYLMSFIREIGGLSFEESDVYPGGDGPVHIAPSETLTFAEVQAGRPFPIGLPAWVPEGMAPQDDVRVTRFDEGFTPVEIRWEDGRASFILTVSQPFSLYIGTQAVEEVLVNGQPAALVHGAWNANRQEWDDNIFLTLMWKLGEQSYSLQSTSLDSDTLIRIAESIQAP